MNKHLSKRTWSSGGMKEVRLQCYASSVIYSSTDSTERVPQMLIGLQLKQNASEDLTLLPFRQTVKEKPGNPCLAQGLRGCLGSLTYSRSALMF